MGGGIGGGMGGGMGVGMGGGMGSGMGGGMNEGMGGSMGGGMGNMGGLGGGISGGMGNGMGGGIGSNYGYGGRDDMGNGYDSYSGSGNYSTGMGSSLGDGLMGNGMGGRGMGGSMMDNYGSSSSYGSGRAGNTMRSSVSGSGSMGGMGSTGSFGSGMSSGAGMTGKMGSLGSSMSSRENSAYFTNSGASGASGLLPSPSKYVSKTYIKMFLFFFSKCQMFCLIQKPLNINDVDFSSHVSKHSNILPCQGTYIKDILTFQIFLVVSSVPCVNTLNILTHSPLLREIFTGLPVFWPKMEIRLIICIKYFDFNILSFAYEYKTLH